MAILGHIFRLTEVMNTLRSSNIVISRRKYVHGSQFGLIIILDNQTGFFKFLNINYSLYLSHVVVSVLVTGILDFYLLLTCTLVPVTTASFHVDFELFNGISSLFVNGLFPIISPYFLICRNF